MHPSPAGLRRYSSAVPREPRRSVCTPLPSGKNIATVEGERHEAVVVGAGPAGLAAAAMLQREGLETLVVEREAVGSSWRKHYDRLHLHTVRWLSDLPGLPIDRREGRWVSRDGVVRYLERYVLFHGLNVRTNVEVEGV